MEQTNLQTLQTSPTSAKENTSGQGEFESLQINLASTEKIIHEWSHGEVTKPETINYRTLKPEPEGLFCERIFGPIKDWECHCGKYKKVRNKGITCERCGVEVTKSKVRRERMGHITLAAPVSHIWYYKGTPSRIGQMLDLSPKTLEKVLYFASYIVTDPKNTELTMQQILTDQEYKKAKENHPLPDEFEAGMGAEYIRKLLAKIDLDKLSKELREELEKATNQKKAKLSKRLEIVEAFRSSNSRPEWMILEAIPVIPPDLRPMVQLDGGRFATSDLNDLYRRVLNRNNRLKKLLELGAPDIIVRNEKRMLQESVDALIDNGRRGQPVKGPGQRALKSLSDMLKGKQGRFRQNLLGKRVDYSGRSVIVVGPSLKFYQCGLPKAMALELFKPFITKGLVDKGAAQNIKSAKRMVERANDAVWDVLDAVIKDHPVLLNRAPTLHRLGIQAFEPVLVEGKAIKLHPLVCTAYNADFDGDQMAIHVPLSIEAQAEARFLMLSVNNILAPKDGSPITTPTQDMILGSYYLTFPGICQKERGEGLRPEQRVDEFENKKQSEQNAADGFVRRAEKGDGKVFTDEAEMLMAYQAGVIGIHAKVKVRVKDKNGQLGPMVESTVGRFIFNEQIPQDLGYVDRKKDPYGMEICRLVKKKDLTDIIDKCFRKYGNTKTVEVMDYIKNIGFKYSTKAAISISIGDMEMPPSKARLIEESQKKVDAYNAAYRRGLMTEKERYNTVIQIWHKTTDKVGDELMEYMPLDNNLKIMADSGARGSKNQIRQVGGMRGLMGNATGKTIEVPITANFREGLTVMEYFLSSNGARKGLTDTALRTADSGYLTRRLVDVSHNVIVRTDDCGSTDGIEVFAFQEESGTGKKEVIEALWERIAGRTVSEDVIDPNTGEILATAGEELSDKKAKAIDDAGIESVKIRSIMNCRCKYGICAKCYGRNLATGEHVKIGEAVGIIAAQSIGEPGTQLTMRTFHSGGISIAGNDITQGLPRVEELFEARRPKGVAVICEIDGTITEIKMEKDSQTKITIQPEEQGKANEVVDIPYGANILVKVGDKVYKGQGLNKGPLYPQDILRLQGVSGVYQYLVKEVQKVYKQQGVSINDKHIEVIVSQMLSKVKVSNAGDTYLLPDGVYSAREFEEANKKIEKENKKIVEENKEAAEPKELKKEAESTRALLGITKTALSTESFLSAASFQETTRVLADAAVRGKIDHLNGLKENVIIGKLIPAGTGMKEYRNIRVNYGDYAADIENYKKEEPQKESEEEQKAE